MNELEVKDQTKCEKIIFYILSVIKSERFDKSSPLPSENFLITKFKVSRETVRSAFLDLKIRGLIKSKKGSGYFLNDDFSFNKIESIRKQLQSSKQVIFIETNLNTKSLISLIAKLNLSINDVNVYDFISYIKVFYVNDKPVRYTKSFLNKSLFKLLDFEKIEYSLMEYLLENSILPSKLTSKLEVQKKSEVDNQFLIDDDQELIMSRISVLYSKENQIIEISEHKINLENFSTSYIKYL
ncbi:GntR family transcriptional regulator [Mesoplasma seiffertii]|uniref:GntR family transcriptional regulator n=1 Tax=Mesoplasma seiffertii TaxID=28224 RepID=UPI00047BB7F3|nr:GntR family transcriptional regulator [Mesoplasma seiffertii]